MRINFNSMAGTVSPKAVLSLVLPVLGEGKGEENRWHCLKPCNQLCDQIQPPKFPSYRNQFSFLLRLDWVALSFLPHDQKNQSFIFCESASSFPYQIGQEILLCLNRF